MSFTFVRPRRRRIRRAAVTTAAVLGAVSGGQALIAGTAHAGTFTVSQCNKIDTASWTAKSYQASAWSGGGTLSGCTGDGGYMKVTVTNNRLYANEYVDRFLTLPSSMAKTTIGAVDLAYRAMPQIAGANPAYFSFWAGSATIFNVPSGSFSSGAHHAVPAGTRRLNFQTWCSPVNGPGYCNWSGHLSELRGLTLTLQESVAPTTDASGALLGAGAQSGTRSLKVTGNDADSGIKTIAILLGGVNVGTASFTAACDDARMSPCPNAPSEVLDIDTTKVGDGSRLLRLVATDLAGNSKTVDKGYVTVDNVPPPLSTALPTISGEKRVNRTLSGLGGTWTGSSMNYAYRWERYGAGGWENIPDATTISYTTSELDAGKRLRLKVTATNTEGSTVAYSDATNPISAPGALDLDGDFDRDGIPNATDPDDDNDGVRDTDDVAPFDGRLGIPPAPSEPGAVGIAPTPTAPATTSPAPLIAGPAPRFETINGQGGSAAAHLVAQFTDTKSRKIRARYGQRRRITGSLLSPDGKPIIGAQLDVTSQTLSMGSTPVLVSRISTNTAGRFSYTVPVGPSRTVRIAYKWFRESNSYTHTTAVTVNVVPRVTLKANKRRLRNKQSVRFSGKVAGAPRGARKVVELRALVGRSWRTFATARLSASGGTFRYSYRFNRTTRPTVYQFRAIVKSEKAGHFCPASRGPPGFRSGRNRPITKTMPVNGSIRRGTGALAAFVAAGALAVPAHADTLSDDYPTPQAVAAHAEFLSQVPAPPSGAGSVCVIDTGVTPLPDTASQIVERFAIDGGDPGDIYHRPDDPLSGHGSFVAGTIASQVDGRGSAGIWPAAKIISVRVFSRPDAGASAADYRQAIVECLHAGRNVKVITLSLAGAAASPEELVKLEDRIVNARDNFGVNVVAGAGNSGNLSAVSYPARFPAVFAVGASGPDNASCGFSDRGAGLDLSALGCNTLATTFDGTAGWFAGTSYSTPTVAGILLALRSYRPHIGATAAEQLLLDTAQRTSAGLVVDTAAAFRAAGLDSLVDTYPPPPPPQFPAPVVPPAPDSSSHHVRDTVVVTPAVIGNDRPSRPKLRSATFRRHRMRVRISRPPRGMEAIFRVGRKSYVRGTGFLNLRVQAWRKVSVLIEDQWGDRSEPLKVRRPARR